MVERGLPSKTGIIDQRLITVEYTCIEANYNCSSENASAWGSRGEQRLSQELGFHEACAWLADVAFSFSQWGENEKQFLISFSCLIRQCGVVALRKKRWLRPKAGCSRVVVLFCTEEIGGWTPTGLRHALADWGEQPLPPP